MATKIAKLVTYIIMTDIQIHTPSFTPNLHTHFTAQADASFALWLATLAKDSTDLTLVICQSQSELQRLADELYFLGYSSMCLPIMRRLFMTICRYTKTSSPSGLIF